MNSRTPLASHEASRSLRARCSVFLRSDPFPAKARSVSTFTPYSKVGARSTPNSIDRSSARRSTMSVSQPSGRWGPCCSHVPTGTMSRGSSARIAATCEGMSSFRRRGVPAGSEDAISELTRVQTTSDRLGGGDALASWGLATAIALLALAAWLRDARVEYLAAAWFATLACAGLVFRAAGTRARVWRGIAAAVVLFGCAAASVEQREIGRVHNDWATYDAAQRAAAAQRMEAELSSVRDQLADVARRALLAPTDRSAAFAMVGGLTGGVGERAVVLYECDEPLAWSGTVRVATDTLASP